MNWLRIYPSTYLEGSRKPIHTLEYPVTDPIIEPGTSRIQVQRNTNSTNIILTKGSETNLVTDRQVCPLHHAFTSYTIRRCGTNIIALLTPWSRVLLGNLTGFQLVKKFPVFYGTRRSIPAFTNARHLSQSWARSIQSILPAFHFLKIHLNIILPSTPGFHNRSISVGFPHQNPVYASPDPHTRYTPLPSHSSRFYHPNNIGWGVQIIKLLVM